MATSRYFAQHPPKGTEDEEGEEEDDDNKQMATSIMKEPEMALSSSCSHYFLDPLAWMRDELEKGLLDGRLECPKCKSNIGRYAWQGMRCSCGAWIVPGISIARGRVDEVKPMSAGSLSGRNVTFDIRRPPDGVGTPGGFSG